MHGLTDYAFFLLKTITIVIALLALLMGILAVGARSKSQRKDKGKLIIEKMNQHYEDMVKTFNQVTHTKTEYKQSIKKEKQDKKQQEKEKKRQEKAEKQQTKQQHHDDTGTPTDNKPRLFVLTFHGDIKASGVDSLRQEVTGILLAHRSGDEVLVRLESGGGLVNSYGLVASQLERLKAHQIKLTAAVDKVAASGGYMAACVADTVISAPFAIIGSIGVIVQLPNFNRYLHKKAIDIEQLTAGKFKRTVTMLGKNTAEGRAKLQEELEETHDLFKQHVTEYRPGLDIDTVATGEHWYGRQALDLKLVDKLQTSDDFLMAAKKNYDLYAVRYQLKPSLLERLGESIQNAWMTVTHVTARHDR